MTPTDLQKQISLSPRAIIITGTLVERMKKSPAEGTDISGFAPHHAIQGIPLVPFNGEEPQPTYMDGACIECAIREQTPLAAAAMSYGNALNLVHMVFGSKAIAPSTNELKCLREAGQILQQNVGRQIHLAALPILVAGQYGVAQGRLYVLGLFDQEGNALFVNPAAKEKLLHAEFPAAQKVRTLTAQLAPAPAAEKTLSALPEWYQTTADTVAVLTKQKGAKLHEAVMDTRAASVARTKKISLKAAAAEVAAEYEACQKAAAQQPAKTIPVAAPAAAPKRTMLRASV